MSSIEEGARLGSSEDDGDPNIAPPDHGRCAWWFLVGCFWIEGLTWGFPFSYGVFQKYYSNHEQFSPQSSQIALVGTTMLAFIYYGAVVTTVVLQKWPHARHKTSILGLCTMIVSLVTASFAQRVAHLILTQGLLYGAGGSLLYSPFIFYLDEWFDRRKGFAYGFLWAGTAVGGTVVPLILEWGLKKYGFRVMLRAWALLLAVSLSPLIYLVRPRLPVAPKGTTERLDLRFLRTFVFWFLQCGNAIQGLGFLMPSIYLPTFATSIGFAPIAATSLVSLLNCAQIGGTVFFGFLIDRFATTNLLFVCSLGSATSVFVFWGLANSPVFLWLFAITYGIFAGGYTAMFTGCNREVQKRAPHAGTGLLMGTWAGGRGIGAIASGPISERLLKLKLWEGTLKSAYGTKYGLVIVFIGITAVLGGLGGLLLVFGRQPVISHEDQDREKRTETGDGDGDGDAQDRVVSS